MADKSVKKDTQMAETLNNSADKQASEDAKLIRVSYIVDQQDGPYYTIQSAINDAKPNCTIKITTGLYKENLVIKTNFLKIESKDFNPEVYIMGNKGPALTIDIPEGGNCLIQNLKFVHKGGAPRLKTKNNQGNFDLIGLDGINRMEHIIQRLEYYHKSFESVMFSNKVDSIIYVKSGGIILRNCLLSLSFVMKCNQDVIPLILINEGTSNMIANCQLKGNNNFPTMGIVVKKANCIIKETEVSDFSKGGILMWLEDPNSSKIFTSKVENCKQVGIQIIGSCQSPLIEYCTVQNNPAPGIQICTGSSCQVRKSTICNNHDGIDIISADPIIFKNNISRNNHNGI